MLLYVWQVLHPMEIKYILLKGHGRAMAFLLFQYPLGFPVGDIICKSFDIPIH